MPSTRSSVHSSCENDTVLTPLQNKQSLKLKPLSFADSTINPEQALSVERQHGAFNTLTLGSALWTGCSSDAVKQYLQHSPRESVLLSLKSEPIVQKHHILFYAIHRNDPGCIRLLLEYDMSANTRDFADVPALAFAIMRSAWDHENHLGAVIALLSGGADPHVIPSDMWAEYVKTPNAISDGSLPPSVKETAWCTPYFRNHLAKTMNLSIRYNLWKASRVAGVKQGELQVAKAKNITALFQVPYVIIGQELAAQMVVRCIFGHIAMHKPTPLVLASAGLSGHGKTELATRMGNLLSADFLDIDCTQQTSVYSIIGATNPYYGYQEGGPLNNFLARNAGQRGVVFLDEYDKTEKDVRNALLKTMDTGFYRDRRSEQGEEIDCSKVIWILATNKGDSAIANFHAKHIATRKDEDILQVSLKPLQVRLKKMFMELYSPAITGRINLIVPFFPFSPNEQAVVAHKFLLKLQDSIRKPIDLQEPIQRHLGKVLLQIEDDGRVCQHLAKTGYIPELGARSLSTAVDEEVSQKLEMEYFHVDELVTEDMNKEPYQEFVMQLNAVTDDIEEISVFRKKVDKKAGKL